MRMRSGIRQTQQQCDKALGLSGGERNVLFVQCAAIDSLPRFMCLWPHASLIRLRYAYTAQVVPAASAALSVKRIVQQCAMLAAGA